MTITSALVRALVSLPRRAGAYAYGIVFGFPNERRYGNHPGYRHEPSARAGATDGLQGAAHLGAVGTAIAAASAGS
ncbi:hypothetical protein [Quadrisphaera granulorum]|nr:hypothetical protein [Quadrisphaera granulorum]